MDKPPDLLDRDGEWTLLDEVWRTKRSELLVMVGRRRVGKSFLLTRFARACGGLYYQATRKTEAEQLRALARAAGEQLGDSALARGASFAAWEPFLDWVLERAKSGPFLLILDELPYLTDAAPALASILQTFWDARAGDARVKLVLSGSFISAMHRLTTADAPLYGRRSRQLGMRPFSYLDAARFFPGHPSRDRLIAYGTFGGLPGNLALLDAERSVEKNIIASLFDPSTRLFEEGGQFLEPLLPDTAVYYSILEAIADGEQTWSKIANRVGRQTSALSRPLAWLQEMQLVERILPITSKPTPHAKEALYRLADPYLRFWQRTIAPAISSGASRLLAPADLWKRYGAPALPRHMGGVLEQACRDFVASPGRLPFQPVRVGEWWDARAQEQVDVVALGGNGELFAAECKWGKACASDLSALERRADLIARQLGSVRKVVLGLFAAGGLRGRQLQQRVAAGELLAFSLDDLFATAR